MTWRSDKERETTVPFHLQLLMCSMSWLRPVLMSRQANGWILIVSLLERSQMCLLVRIGLMAQDSKRHIRPSTRSRQDRSWSAAGAGLCEARPCSPERQGVPRLCGTSTCRLIGKITVSASHQAHKVPPSPPFVFLCFRSVAVPVRYGRHVSACKGPRKPSTKHFYSMNILWHALCSICLLQSVGLAAVRLSRSPATVS